MKKLMIAAAIAALAGVTFADCDVGVDCAFAYRVKLAGKTVTGKAKTTGSEKTCDLEANCWAKPASLRIAGYIYGATEPGDADACEGCACNEMTTFKTVYWNAAKEQVLAESATAFEVYDVLRSSGAQNKAQVLITIDGLNLAGFANFNPKTAKIKNASGFFAGKLAAPKCAGEYDPTTCVIGEGDTAQVFKPCALTDAVAAEAAIAFGRWTLTYKADKVAALEKNGNVGVLVPAAYKGEAPAPLAD